MTARVRRIDGPTYGDLWRESPTAIAPDVWPLDRAPCSVLTAPTGADLAMRWATMYVRPTREVG